MANHTPGKNVEDSSKPIELRMYYLRLLNDYAFLAYPAGFERATYALAIATLIKPSETFLSKKHRI